MIKLFPLVLKAGSSTITWMAVVSSDASSSSPLAADTPEVPLVSCFTLCYQECLVFVDGEVFIGILVNHTEETPETHLEWH